MTGPTEHGAPRDTSGAARRAVLLRLDPAVHAALARWAADDLRSVNAQVEMLLRRALADAGRAPRDLAPPRRRGRPARAEGVGAIGPTAGESPRTTAGDPSRTIPGDPPRTIPGSRPPAVGEPPSPGVGEPADPTGRPPQE
ncbi:hypothetical protein AGMMS50218_07340 [Actinomycetota bacterium]|nr:hypothetical protein AGMMS50218_07340 [Actinomycetota bacterium]